MPERGGRFRAPRCRIDVSFEDIPDSDSRSSKRGLSMSLSVNPCLKASVWVGETFLFLIRMHSFRRLRFFPMLDNGGASGVPFGEYRGYIKVLAECYLGAKFRAKLDASDLTQETLLKAWKDREQLRGKSDGEIAAWLRSILAHTLANATRDLQRQKRDMNRERSIDAALEESSAMLKNSLAAEVSSPSHHARREETLAKLADALEKLTKPQRESVLLRHGRGLSLTEIARSTGRTHGAVALLVHRGIQRLRRTMRGAKP